MSNEATSRIKINRLLENAGWRFFEQDGQPPNICLEAKATITRQQFDEFGENFEKTKNGYIDFLMLDQKGFPFIVLEAKSTAKHPLIAKEQAREYAQSQNCRFVILSNGDLHYFWDLKRGNPQPITAFPTPTSVLGYKKSTPDPKKLINEVIEREYIALTQRPKYASEAGWKNQTERAKFVEKNSLRFLREYQIQAIQEVQKAVSKGKERFLFEMATGTGKTLTAAALIKLFLRTGNAQRILFLVDRLELEDQANKAFKKLLKNDFKSVIYKEKRDEWRKAEIVVTTVQSLLFGNKYRDKFSPTDFDLVISDEAHRSIGGNARAVFDYFIGYKLGLTATPKDYLKGVDEKKANKDPKAHEQRLLRDTFKTFGCEDGEPTFRYTLLQGVKDGYLINPEVADARTGVTTKLLSEKGFVVEFKDGENGDKKEVYKIRQFQKKFFSPSTNQLFCKTFLENGLRDPISGEFGKSIVFSVSQDHAEELTGILNNMADKMFPGKYQSDFAVQVTSIIPEAQQYTINFANNNLLGSGNVVPEYKTSKARVCVTVGMMTTGYDCPDLLNLGLFRPVFSPSDFIQIKGRGTRKHDFKENLFDESLKESLKDTEKTSFKLFDFFANCEYFEEEFDYHQKLKLPKPPSSSEGEGNGGGGGGIGYFTNLDQDYLESIQEEKIGLDGMKIDRIFYQDFENKVRGNEVIAAAVEAGQWDRVIDLVNQKVFDAGEQKFNLDKLRKGAEVDRKIELREILEKIFGLIPRFKSKDELLEEEFAKFITDYEPESVEAIPALKTYFKAYVTSSDVREIIDNKQFTELATNASFSTEDFKAVPAQYRSLIPEYINDYVPLDQFAA